MVQILCTDISSVDQGAYQQLYAAASCSRRERADRYRNFSDAVRCLAGEMLLRQALNAVFGQWEVFSLAQTEHGKPYVVNQPDFHFSISHSGNWVVLAYGRTEVGVDVQDINSKKNTEAVARRFFTEEEQQYLTSQPDPALAFSRIWTGKESYLKYLGTGLAKSLTSFSVLSPDEGIHYFWETQDGCSLCLCTREESYNLRFVDIKYAPA